jgi:hypothetical protein
MKGLSRLDWLGERSKPHYGQLMLGVLLLFALSLCLYFETHFGGTHSRGQRTGPASVISWLPDDVLLNQVVFIVCGALFISAALLWLCQHGLPWSSWCTVLTFTAVVALYLENASQATHVAHLTNMLLIVYAMWYHFYSAEMRRARLQGNFWNTPLYPRWVHALGVFTVGIFYGWSGLSKLLESGPAWANGISLQLWVSLWGDPNSRWTRLILSHRTLAQGMQTVTLIAETSAFPAIFFTRLRPFVGLALIGFHAGSICVFGWGFHANMVILALVYLPVFTWVERAFG